MPTASEKIACAFCGGAMKIDFVEPIKDEQKRQRIRVHFRCKSKDCGRPYIDGRSVAECVAAARRQYSKKAREATKAARRPGSIRVLIHDEVETNPVSDLTKFGELLKAKENGTDQNK